MFDFMTNEDNFGMDPPVDDSMREDWSVVEPDGTRKAIGTPAVHDGKDIYFRFI